MMREGLPTVWAEAEIVRVEKAHAHKMAAQLDPGRHCFMLMAVALRSGDLGAEPNLSVYACQGSGRPELTRTAIISRLGPYSALSLLVGPVGASSDSYLTSAIQQCPR